MELRKARSGRPARAAQMVGGGILLIILGVVLLGVPAGTPRPALAASSSELNKKLGDVRSELEEIRDNLAKAENAKKAAEGDIAALDKSIDAAEKALRAAESAHAEAAGQLAALQEEVERLTIGLARKQYELAEAEFELAQQQSVYNNRVVDVYKSGGSVSYLAVVLDSASFAELVGRVDLLSTIVGQDNDILEQIKALRARVEEQRALLETERARVAALEKAQEAVTEELRVAEKERQAALDELETARAAKAKVLATAKKEVAAWSAQEEDQLAESARVAELLRKAKAAEAAAAKTGTGALARPAAGAIASAFGYRIHPIFKVRMMHTGIDIDADMGAPIKAAEEGTVISAGWRGGYGKCIVISHAGGLATLYGHASEILVSAGQKVKRGDMIGKVGSTGYSTGPHLHFEVRVDGTPVDPLGYL